jgi:hypothetical protein
MGTPNEVAFMDPTSVKKEPASYQAKFSYGRFLYYPVNEAARELCKTLTHTKSLTKEQAEFLMGLGVRLKLRGVYGF